MSSSDYVVLFVVVIFSIIYAVNAAVPPGWTCNASYYNASDGCHCNCGIRDPDCDNKNSTFYNVTYGCPCADMYCYGAQCRGDCDPVKTEMILTQLNTFTILTIINTMLIGIAFLVVASLVAIRFSTDPLTVHRRPGGESVKDMLINIYNFFVTCNGKCNKKARLQTDFERELEEKMREEEDM